METSVSNVFDGVLGAAGVVLLRSLRSLPHCPQKLAFSCTGAPQLGQVTISGKGV